MEIKIKKFKKYFIVDTTAKGSACPIRYRYRLLNTWDHCIQFNSYTGLPCGFIIGFNTPGEATEVLSRLNDVESLEATAGL